MARVMSLDGRLSMAWNSKFATVLRPEQVLRWYACGGEREGMSHRAVAEFVKLSTICHLGEGDVDLEALIDDFHRWLSRAHLRLDRETLLHELALPFCVDRARAQRWTLPATLEARHRAAVLKLIDFL